MACQSCKPPACTRNPAATPPAAAAGATAEARCRDNKLFALADPNTISYALSRHTCWLFTSSRLDMYPGTPEMERPKDARCPVWNVKSESCSLEVDLFPRNGNQASGPQGRPRDQEPQMDPKLFPRPPAMKPGRRPILSSAQSGSYTCGRPHLRLEGRPRLERIEAGKCRALD